MKNVEHVYDACVCIDLYFVVVGAEDKKAIGNNKNYKFYFICYMMIIICSSFHYTWSAIASEANPKKSFIP